MHSSNQWKTPTSLIHLDHWIDLPDRKLHIQVGTSHIYRLTMARSTDDKKSQGDTLWLGQNQ